jgi:hypothetical protein
MMDLPTRINAIDRTTLTPLVRRALGREAAEVTDWDQTTLSGGSTGAGVFRFSGSARDGTATVPWVLVLKVVPRQGVPGQGLGTSDDPTHQLYWKRELLVAQSGLLEELPVGLRAPTCYSTAEWSDGYWLWLEAVHDSSGQAWPLERFGLAARHLGRLGGAYLAQFPLPDWPWLTRGLVRQRVPMFAGTWDSLPRLLDHPIMRRGFPGAVADGMLRLWAERETFLSALDRLPTTLQHGDAGRKNLYAIKGGDGAEATLAIDWGFLGVGVVGEELAPIVLSALIWFNGVEPEQLPELDGLAFAGYLQGLRDAGWSGEAQAARLGYAATLALRFGLLIPEAWTLDEGGRERLEKLVGHPVEEAVDRYAAMRRFVLARADEAQQLIQSRSF